MRIAVAHFDEVSEHLVVANFERADARARPLLALNSRDCVLPAIPQRTPFIERRVNCLANTGLVADRHRRVIYQRPQDLLAEVSTAVPQAGVTCERIDSIRRSSAIERDFDRRQTRDRVTERAQFPR